MNGTLRAMLEARNFPANTCSASRHASQIAEALITGRPCHALTDDPENAGESIAATVQALWETRAVAEKLRLRIYALHTEEASAISCLRDAQALLMRMRPGYTGTHGAPTAEEIDAVLAMTGYALRDPAGAAGGNTGQGLPSRLVRA